MKIVVFSDAHGNKYALEKIINSFDYESSDYRLFLGDAITLGPHTNECVDILRHEHDLVFTMGNNDSYVVCGLSESEASIKSEIKLEHISDVLRELSKENIEYLKSRPKDYLLEVENVKLYFTHFAWESDTEVIEDPPNMKKKTVYEIFKDVDCNYIIFGHMHNRSYNKYKGKVMVGIGSIGAKYKGNYLVIDVKGDKVKFKLKRLKYDYQKLKDDWSKCTDRCRKLILDNEMKETFTNGK